MSELVLYTSPDGQTRLHLRLEGQTVWLTQLEMAELFQRAKSTINEHLGNIFSEGELSRESVIRKFRITAADGKDYDADHYSLEAILAVGFRVKSPRGTQFRQWANTQLKEYLVKGFVMDDERLKNPGGWDYFDELLARIREIRASEKRFYQKVRDLFSLSSDYQAATQETNLFFAEVQNKLLYAVTGHTAAELVLQRADASQPNMALVTWSGSRVRKHDIVVAKNYLNADEMDSLNRLTVIFLEQAELRVKQRKDLTLDFWRNNVDKMLEFNDQPVLQGAGSISRAQMVRQVQQRFEQFDAQRRAAERAQADAQDLQQLEQIEQSLKPSKGKK